VVTIYAQTKTLGYGQIPSTLKSVSALDFNVAQRMGLFAGEGNQPRNDRHRGRRREHDGSVESRAETGDLKPPLPPPERFVDLQRLRIKWKAGGTSAR
jgi:hypothetical protein